MMFHRLSFVWVTCGSKSLDYSCRLSLIVGIPADTEGGPTHLRRANLDSPAKFTISQLHLTGRGECRSTWKACNTAVALLSRVVGL